MTRTINIVTKVTLLAVILGLLMPGAGFACQYLSSSLGTFKGDHNADMEDYGILFYNASDPACAAQVAGYLHNKIRATLNNSNPGFQRWLGGVTVTLAVTTALQVGYWGEVTQDLATDLEDMATLYKTQPLCLGDPNCGNSCDPSRNTCLDDRAIAAEAYAWLAAYKHYRGLESEKTWFVTAAKNQLNLGMTTNNICVAVPQWWQQVVPVCQHPTSASALNALLQSGSQIVPFNHDMEYPHYGIGLMTSVSSAVFALQLAGNDWTPNALQSGLGKGLFTHGQQKSYPTGSSYRNACAVLRIGTGELPLLNQPCHDDWQYTPKMIPVYQFMHDKFGVTKSNIVSAEQTAPPPSLAYWFNQFDESLFTPHPSDHRFSWGRKAIYRDQGWKWPYVSGQAPNLYFGPVLWIRYHDFNTNQYTEARVPIDDPQHRFDFIFDGILGRFETRDGNGCGNNGPDNPDLISLRLLGNGLSYSSCWASDSFSYGLDCLPLLATMMGQWFDINTDPRNSNVSQPHCPWTSEWRYWPIGFQGHWYLDLSEAGTNRAFSFDVRLKLGWGRDPNSW
jgi:hypothetical protein